MRASLAGQQIGVSRYSRYRDAAAAAGRCLTDARAQRRRALADGTPPAMAALYDDEDVKSRGFLRRRRSRRSLAEHAVARPAATTGGHYTEISLVYYM